MSKTGDWHNQAMALTDAALRERRQGNRAAAKEFFGQALQQELAALAGLEESDNLARSILHRSAGWLALDCGQTPVGGKVGLRRPGRRPGSGYGRAAAGSIGGRP